jgi:hypothetical protein
MALLQTVTGFTHLPRGFHNRDLCPQIEALLGRPYTTAQMTYDLRRLRLKGLTHRIPTTMGYHAPCAPPSVNSISKSPRFTSRQPLPPPENLLHLVR